MLAIPDASYGQWVARYDLQEVAMFGRQPLKAASENIVGTQEDLVIVTSKKRNYFSDAG
jgi:hypothetical protein